MSSYQVRMFNDSIGAELEVGHGCFAMFGSAQDAALDLLHLMRDHHAPDSDHVREDHGGIAPRYRVQVDCDGLCCWHSD